MTDNSSHMPELAVLSEFLSLTAQEESSGGLHDEAHRLYVGLHSQPRVAVAGEFSSGKSSLVNLLVGTDLVQTSVLASRLPTILYEYGTEQKIMVGWWSDTAEDKREFADLDSAAELKPDFIRVTLPADILRMVSLIDLPGTNDPLRAKERTLEMADNAHILLWCTNAVQAWRETERRTWSQLPGQLKENGILVITHVDLPSIRKSLDRLMKRMTDELSSHFHALIPFQSPKAAKARKDGTVSNKTAWEEAGGAQLLENIATLAATVRKESLASARALIEKEINPRLEALRAEAAASVPKPGEILEEWRSTVDGIVSRVEGDKSIGTDEFLSLCRAAVQDVSRMLEHPGLEGPAVAALKAEFRGAAHMFDQSRLADGDEGPEEAALILLQLGYELGSFAAQDG
ncbi:MAG: dynamin family protein [Rhodobacteraceae bacterium]|nr:dynamin family protein [Paracoccaceae bacterium]